MFELIILGVVSSLIYIWLRGLEHVLIHQRWIFVCIFLMPISVLFDNWLKFRNWLVIKLSSAPKLHKSRVEAIQKEILEWNKDGCNKKMCTARPGWQTVSLRVAMELCVATSDEGLLFLSTYNQVMFGSCNQACIIGKYKETHKKIKIDLMDILHIDEEKQTVYVEPLVSMGQLSNALILQGWTLPIVPELDVLTVGGLIMGCGVETSSHKHGLFQHICVSYDIIMADGSLLYCTKEENSVLFYQIPWSYGTLGFLVAAELKIIRSRKFVKIQYEPINSLNELNTKMLKALESETNDFVECLAYSINKSVLMTGQMTDNCNENRVNEIGKFWKPWFFKHAESYLTKQKSGVEYIPLRDYYHRHTRSLFWELQDIIPFGNNVIFRYLFGWAMPPQIALLKITSPKVILDMYETKHVVQDMLVPIQDLKSSLHCFENHLQIYPLWLCPFKLFNVPGIVHTHNNKDEMYIDIGAYGSPRMTSFNGPDTVQKIEQFVLERKGFQMLYADSYLSQEDFRKMFNHTIYDQIRERYNADSAFPTIYEKVCRKARR